jgi:predicted nicotinamide N-methyase
VSAEPELVRDPLQAAGVTLDLLRPRDPDALLDERAFEHEEFLPYWAEVWPSAAVLADRLAARGVAGLRVLELGCGLGVTGLAAAALGARVTLTDWAPDALALVRRNAERNGLAVETARLDWFAPPPAGDDAWPLVVAADVLYERRHVAALLTTLERVVAPGGEAWIADPGRPPAEAFWAAATERWTVQELPPHAGERPRVRVLRRRG